MPLYTAFPKEIHEVDVIVAGGGSAGCIVASRLAEADPRLSVLLIEQGADNYQKPSVVHPALFYSNLQPENKTALFWKANKAPQLADREPEVQSGGTLGGGSSINWMVYTRAQREDFDSWQTPGWGADDVLPFLKKLETYHGRGEAKHHGYSGPIHVSSGTYRATRAENAFIEAATAVGYPLSNDLQNLDSNQATERWLRYVSPSGQRQDTAHRFLHPKLQSDGYPNLHVLVENQVVRVMLDEDKHATGIEYQPNSNFQAGGPPRTVSARKMVVLSAGACSTPQILERSGIGNPKYLDKAGVPVIVDLPGVGHDYQDHELMFYHYRTNLNRRETLNDVISGRSDIQAMAKDNDELLGWNCMDASGKFRPLDHHISAMSEAFKDAWKKDFEPAPNRPLVITALYSGFFGDHETLPDKPEEAQYVAMAVWTAYPYSRGHIHITGPGVGDRLDFDVGYFADAGDVDMQKHIWAYKISRSIARRMDIFRGEHRLSHPRFSSGSHAACVEKSDGPLEEEIEYSEDDNKAIEQYIRENGATVWHSLGTCKMAPREKGGVVSPNLDVYGAKGLKIADLSIPPENVGANTNNTAMMIGEKAADIFARELGIGH